MTGGKAIVGTVAFGTVMVVGDGVGLGVPKSSAVARARVAVATNVAVGARSGVSVGDSAVGRDRRLLLARACLYLELALRTPDQTDSSAYRTLAFLEL